MVSYGNWKHILGVFSFCNSIFNGISIIKPTLRDPIVFFLTWFGEVVFFFFFFYFFLSHESSSSFLFSNCCYCFCFVVEIDFVNRRVWPLYRNGSHKKVEKLSDEKVSEVCQTGGYRKLGYFKWWVMSDENWARSDEWWKKKSK